jgi:hypothetical protein
MKRGTFLLIILISIFLVSLIKADSFTIGWGSQEGELTIGGSEINSPVSAGGNAAVIPPPSQPPSGGGGAITPAGNLSLDKSLLTIKMKKGEQNQQRVVITNNLASSITISISVINLSNFVFLSENKITLKPGESRNVIFNIYVSENVKENLLVGQIVFQSSDTVKYVNVVLDLSERAPLFDIKTTLLKKMLFKGQEAIANVKVLNLGDLKNIDVQLESGITDSKSNIYDSTKESFAINDSSIKKVSLQVPRNIPLGNYIFFSKVSYGNISATSYDSFQIIKGVVELGTAVLYIATAIIFTLIALVSTVLVRRVRNEK